MAGGRSMKLRRDVGNGTLQPVSLQTVDQRSDPGDPDPKFAGVTCGN